MWYNYGMFSKLLYTLGDISDLFCVVQLIVMRNVLQMSSKARVNTPICKEVFFLLLQNEPKR